MERSNVSFQCTFVVELFLAEFTAKLNAAMHQQMSAQSRCMIKCLCAVVYIWEKEKKTFLKMNKRISWNVCILPSDKKSTDAHKSPDFLCAFCWYAAEAFPFAWIPYHMTHIETVVRRCVSFGGASEFLFV